MSWNPLNPLKKMSPFNRSSSQPPNHPNSAFSGTGGPSSLSSSSSSSTPFPYNPDRGNPFTGDGSDPDPWENKRIVLEREVSLAEVLNDKVTKESKRFTDAVLSCAVSHLKVTGDLCDSELGRTEPAIRDLMDEWHSFSITSKQSADNLKGTINNVVTEPGKRMNRVVWKQIKNELKKSQDTSVRIGRLRDKEIKLKEKERTGTNINQRAKLKEQIEEEEGKRRDFNRVLEQEIPLLILSREKMLQPSVEALVRAEIVFWGEKVDAFSSFKGLKDTVQSQSFTSWDQYEREQTALMDQISRLSIVEGDS